MHHSCEVGTVREVKVWADQEMGKRWPCCAASERVQRPRGLTKSKEKTEAYATPFAATCPSARLLCHGFSLKYSTKQARFLLSRPRSQDGPEQSSTSTSTNPRTCCPSCTSQRIMYSAPDICTAGDFHVWQACSGCSCPLWTGPPAPSRLQTVRGRPSMGTW